MTVAQLANHRPTQTNARARDVGYDVAARSARGISFITAIRSARGLFSPASVGANDFYITYIMYDK